MKVAYPMPRAQLETLWEGLMSGHTQMVSSVSITLPQRMCTQFTQYLLAGRVVYVSRFATDISGLAIVFDGLGVLALLLISQRPIQQGQRPLGASFRSPERFSIIVN